VPGGGPRVVEGPVMSNTFDTVDNKVAETEFFWRKMRGVGWDMFAFRCYFSAFLASSRTVTLALQQFKHIPGFTDWYDPHRVRLARDPLARFFLEQRNLHIHGGKHPVSGGSMTANSVKYHFTDLETLEENRAAICRLAGVEYVPEKVSPNVVPKTDVLSASRQYFTLLLEIVHDCYVVLGPHIDPQQHYTEEHFASMERDINCAEVELWGVVRSSLIDEGFTDEDRWVHVREHVAASNINHLFYMYLGKTTPSPSLPEGYSDFEEEEEIEGWNLVPAGYETIEEWAANLGESKRFWK